nr:immunoglobulin heavy chain junction region [Mus musculus]
CTTGYDSRLYWYFDVW